MKKRITILGGGESGTGAALLAQVKGYAPFVSDAGLMKEHYKQELTQAGIEWEENGHTEENVLNATLIIKSPGIPDTAPMVKKAKEKKISVVDEIEFTFRHIESKIIAITGTNGKTTTTLLTYHLLKEAGFDVALAGNVGESFAKKAALGSHAWYVVEVSNFQLDGCTSFRPDIGILLNITPDHLNRYEYKMENYIASKFRLIQSMNQNDCFIYFAQDNNIDAWMKSHSIIPQCVSVGLNTTDTDIFSKKEKMIFGLEKQLIEISQAQTSLKGPHNLINTMCAVTAALKAGVNEKQIRKALKSFVNAPHRLELVGELNQVQFINDSKATNVDSVVYALGTYKQPLIWIAGGEDKGNDYKLIEQEVKKKVKQLICLGVDNSKLKKAFQGVVPSLVETKQVTEAVQIAFDSAKQGDVVLLSPACASFDLFKNYEDRGNQFRQAVLQEIKKRQNQPV